MGREQGTHQGGRAESRPHGRRCEAASGPVAPALGQRRPARAPQTRRTADALSLWLSRSLPLSSGALRSCTDFGRGRTLMAKFVTITDDTGSQIVINVDQIMWILAKDQRNRREIRWASGMTTYIVATDDKDLLLLLN